jgi:HNH endonuclease
MRRRPLSRLDKNELFRRFNLARARERGISAEVLAYIAEIDRRKLYRDRGYGSMFSFLVGEHGYSDDAALKRIQAARASRSFPILLSALADGRLHLTAICLLAPHLTVDNARGLVAEATHRRSAEIERLLALREVRLETLGAPVVRPSSDAAPESIAFAEPVRSELLDAAPSGSAPIGLAPAGSEPSIHSEQTPLDQGLDSPELSLMIPQHAVRHVAPSPHLATQAPATPTTTVPARLPEPAVMVALEKRVHEKLQYLRSLLSHSLPSDSQVIERALDELIPKAEKAKFAATEKPRVPRRDALGPHYVPAEVRRAVWSRDGGQCTSVGDGGKRCDERQFLEYDHINPVARGGKATVENIRLRCSSHNQYEAEKAFGAAFMENKREQARQVRGEARSLEPDDGRVAERAAPAYRSNSMAKPALNGTAKLSSRGRGKSSNKVAATAPAKATCHGRCVTPRAKRKDTTRHAIEPSSVFLEPKRWMRPQALPTRAAAVSPRIKAPSAATQISRGKIITEMSAAMSR